MKRYLSIFLWAAVCSGVYASEGVSDENFDVEKTMIDGNETDENNASQAVKTTINRLRHYKTLLDNYNNMLDNLWPVIETDLQEHPELLDEFSDYKTVIQSGVDALNDKIDDAISVLDNINSDFDELNEFRFSDVMNLFTQKVSKLLSFFNHNRDQISSSCYNQVVPVLQKLLKLSVALQTVFLFKEILGDDDTALSCNNCCLLF